jgi:hypothetical protein
VFFDRYQCSLRGDPIIQFGLDAQSSKHRNLHPMAKFEGLCKIHRAASDGRRVLISGKMPLTRQCLN